MPRLQYAREVSFLELDCPDISSRIAVTPQLLHQARDLHSASLGPGITIINHNVTLKLSCFSQVPESLIYETEYLDGGNVGSMEISSK